MCALRLSLTETSLGSARPAKRILTALFAKNALRKETTRVTESGLRGIFRGAVTAEIPHYGMRQVSAQNIKATLAKTSWSYSRLLLRWQPNSLLIRSHGS